MSDVLETLTQRLALLQKYEARYGPLDDGAGEVRPARASSSSAVTLRAPPLSTPAPEPTQLHPSYPDGLQVMVSQATSRSVSAAGSGVNTPESSPD